MHELVMNPLLADKLKELSQKRFHQTFLNDAPVKVADFFRTLDFLMGSEVNEPMKNWYFPTYKDGKLTTTRGLKDEFWCNEFDVLEEARSLFLDKSKNASGQLYLWFGDDSPVYKNSTAGMESWLPALFSHITERGNIFCLLSSIDGSWGVAIDNYCGYLEGSSNPNPTETVYEVFGW